MRRGMTASRGVRCERTVRERVTVERLFRLLSHHYDVKDWWPADGPFEVAVGAILTQNTNWRNAASAISALRDSGMLSPERIAATPQPELEALIRPSGSFRRKAATLRLFSSLLLDSYGGDMALMSAAPGAELRRSLIAVRGIGEETADAIMLYACGKPVFVADAYARRVLRRVGACDGKADYGSVKRLVEESTGADRRVCALFHALIVEFAKDVCRRTPRCGDCFIADCRYRVSVRHREECCLEER